MDETTEPSDRLTQLRTIHHHQCYRFARGSAEQYNETGSGTKPRERQIWLGTCKRARTHLPNAKSHAVTWREVSCNVIFHFVLHFAKFLAHYIPKLPTCSSRRRTSISIAKVCEQVFDVFVRSARDRTLLREISIRFVCCVLRKMRKRKTFCEHLRFRGRREGVKGGPGRREGVKGPRPQMIRATF